MSPKQTEKTGQADNESAEEDPGNPHQRRTRMEQSLERFMNLSRKLQLEEIQRQLAKEGAKLSVSLEKVNTEFKLKFDMSGDSAQRVLKLRLSAENWMSALEFGKLRLASVIAPKYFAFLLRVNQFKLQTKSLRKFVVDFCACKNVQILRVQTLENLNKFLGKVNVRELSHLERDFSGQNFSKLLKKIFKKGLQSKVEMLFEDVENDQTTTDLQIFKGILVCSKKNIFQLECQTDNLSVAKQVTSLVFMCMYFASVPSFYLELESVRKWVQ